MMKLIDRLNGRYCVENDIGQRFVFSAKDVRDLAVLFLLENLKADIAFDMDEMDGDYINLSNLSDEQKQEYRDDVYAAFEERITEELVSPSNEDIWNEILNQARDNNAEV